ncbi:MAG TPA: hypothetical protein VGB59_06140 [Allosphingosinicella sp.]|jgi:phosphoglycerol transferase MdoB-like AlkP superfamily enzyme
MANEAETIEGRRGGLPWRAIGWSIPAILLLLPLVAMQFTKEVNWTASDFFFAAVLFGSVGAAFELIVRWSGSLTYRLGAALAVLMAFLTIWANGAVGMIGDEDNPYNLLFLGVLVVALAGAVAARFQARGMAMAMVVAGVAQAAAAAGGFASDIRGAMFSMVFALPWLLAAALFWNAAGGGTRVQG